MNGLARQHKFKDALLLDYRIARSYESVGFTSLVRNFTECIISVTAYTRIPRDSCRGMLRIPRDRLFDWMELQSLENTPNQNPKIVGI